MKNVKKKTLFIAVAFLAAFILWTFLVLTFDRQPIGPLDSVVGFATLNQTIHESFGVHMPLYILTDWLEVIPLLVVLGFALFGLSQWIKRKKLFAVDRDIITLGIFYIGVFAVFLIFEVFVINHRPVLIEGSLEASYPSSTTMLVMCVIPTAVIQLKDRIKNKALKFVLILISSALIVFMVLCRLISGVHWFTDIVGAALFSIGLVMMYYTYK